MNEVVTIPLKALVSQVSTWNPLKREHGDESFVYIDLSAVDQELKAITAARTLKCAAAPSRARQLIKANDVLVSTVRPNLNGVAIVPPEFDGATASTGFCVIRAKNDLLEPRYVFHWVKSPGFVNKMVSSATGASYPAVSDRIVLESEIPLPPLPKQRHIADILDKADALRTKRRETLAHLARLENSIVEGVLLSRAPNLLALENVAEKGRGSFVNGPFGSDLLTSELQNEGVPVVYIRDIRDAEYVRVSKVCVSSAKADELAFCKVSPGDVLVAKVGDPPGVSAVYPNGEPTAIVTQDVIRIRCDTSVAIPEYISAYLNSSRGRLAIAGITVQATRARISLGDFKKLLVDIPPLNEQRDLVGRLAALRTQREALRQSADRLTELFLSLQTQVLEGCH